MDLKRIAKGKNIYRAGYDPVDGILAVQFVKSGLYRFKGVPEAKWISLQRVPYPDRYFTQAIKGQYPVEKPEKKVTDGRLERTPAKRESDSLLQFAEDRVSEIRDKAATFSTDHADMGARSSDSRTQERRLTDESRENQGKAQELSRSYRKAEQSRERERSSCGDTSRHADRDNRSGAWTGP